MSELIRCSKRTKVLLTMKRDNTGRSIPNLVEYAVLNMPFIPPKDLNNRRGRRF
jgi:hypothetical protein